MKNLVLGLAACGMVLIAAPASYSRDAAVQIRTGDDRASVRIVHRRHRDWRPWWRHHARGDCRVVIIKKRLPNGDRITRRIRRCR